ncbi:MAG: cyclic nucleotide-binding domain-containing protein [Pseudomonadales bacterium]|nr:cyclic nucleotide-binding domain-containing protein [Pseudomonadales bacterium]
MVEKELITRQNILRFSPGETIFKEGHTSTSFYVLKSGEVALSISREGKNIVLEDLKAGEIFGEMAALLGVARSASAIATTYSEVYVYTKEQLNKLMDSAPVAIQKLLKLQLNRITEANERATASASLAHPLIVAAEIIELHAAASGIQSRARPGVTMIAYKPIFESLGRMMGLSDLGVRQLLNNMAKYGFFTLKGSKNKHLEMVKLDLLDQAQKLALEIGHSIAGYYESENEFIDITTLIGFTGANRSNILTKLATGEFADNTFVFRRSEIMDLLNKCGKDFFLKRTIKPIEEWCELEDLSFVDSPTLLKAMGRLETYDLTVLLLGVPDGEAQARLDGCLSNRRREIVENLAEDIDTFSDIDVQLIIEDLFNNIRAIKREPASMTGQ